MFPYVISSIVRRGTASYACRTFPIPVENPTKIVTFLIAATVLAGAPGFAMAQGCAYTERQATMSCAPGTVLDAASGACIAEATS